MNKYKIFLSHLSSESPVAKYIKEFIEYIFAGGIQVFVSTHEWSLRPGDPWEFKIRKELKDSKMILVLLSQDSITRPWVNFEAGAAWLRDIILIPMTHRGITPNVLTRPFSSHQSISLLDPNDINKLIKRISTESELNPVVCYDKYLQFTQEISSLDRQIDEEIARQCLPKQVRSKVRFYLYSKSRTQYRQNLLETDGNAVSCFRKPNIYEVFEDLIDFGQPDVTLINLDEYWVKELVKKGRLEELSDFTKTHLFLDELLSSGTYEGKNWSVPHFLDFSYYAYNKSQGDKLRLWMDNLSVKKDFDTYLNKLKKSLGLDRILVYDFHTPDTCACVIIEFISSFGDGIESFRSYKTAYSKRNIHALKILRRMVGKRNECDFLRGEPLNFESECIDVPFIRGWHSRMSDMPRFRETHMAIKIFPIMGTLGGWHIGILSNAPDMTLGLQSLADLLSKENQQKRFILCAGLPTLLEFYNSSDLARQRDPITHWSLTEIKTYVKSLIKRSNISSYPMIREKLCDLHDQIMIATESKIEEILNKWARQL